MAGRTISAMPGKRGVRVPKPQPLRPPTGIVAFLFTDISKAEGDLEEAWERSLRAAELFNLIGDEIALQIVFRYLAVVAAGTGEPERGARNCMAWRLGWSPIPVASCSPPHSKSEDGLELARSAIGHERANEEWQKGQQMSRDEAMALARALGPPDHRRKGE